MICVTKAWLRGRRFRWECLAAPGRAELTREAGLCEIRDVGRVERLEVGLADEVLEGGRMDALEEGRWDKLEGGRRDGAVDVARLEGPGR